MWELIMLVAFSSTNPGGNGGYMKQPPGNNLEVEEIHATFNTSRDCNETSRDVQQQVARAGGNTLVAACRPRGQSN